jgi:hypothetical protein
MEHLKTETASLGQHVHPDIKWNYEHMKLAIESAQKALDSGDVTGSLENSRIAYACAARVLKAVGR